jgi:hypothetical protein
MWSNFAVPGFPLTISPYSPLIQNLLGDLVQAEHSIAGNDAPFQHERGQHLGESADLVGLLRDRLLVEGQPSR